MTHFTIDSEQVKNKKYQRFPIQYTVNRDEKGHLLKKNTYWLKF